MITPNRPKSPKLLLVDDDPAIIATLSTRFESYDVQVITAFLGTQAIWLAVTERPDAVITDVRMPCGGGDYVVDLLRRRAETRQLPVIVLTGCRDRDTEHHMLTLGVDHYLYKPVRFDALLYSLRRYIHLPSIDRQAMEMNC